MSRSEVLAKAGGDASCAGVRSGASVGALYVHVPFCARKCAYCDFESRATRQDDPRLEAYVGSRVSQIRRAEELGLLDECVTAYVGGGTPTLLGADGLARLCEAVSAACPRLTEFSCEANPDSLTDGVLDAMVASGVSRVSVGVQSLDDDELRELGRLHTADEATRRVGAAVRAGLDVSVDLMCAIPLQTDDSWLRTLDGVLGLGVGHVSVYPLVIEEGTAFARRFSGDSVPWNDEDVQAERMEAAERVLGDAGLVRYEVASYARVGKECAHNVAYWTGVPYLGLGRGAASMLGPSQYEPARRLLPWLPERERGAERMRFSTTDGEVEFLSGREAWAEDLMLGMRLTRGIEARLLDGEPEVRDDLVGRGLVELVGGRLVPTHDGWLLGNELFGALWDLAGE